jgi:hypothetical protein
MQILSSNNKTLVDIFYSAKQQIMFSSPGISDIIAHDLIQVKKDKGTDIKIYLEFDEKSFQQGFGEISAITRLRENNLEFFSKEGLNLYFIITDDTGFFYFPKSLFVEEEGTAKDLFLMTKQQVKTIKLLYGNLDKEDPDFGKVANETDPKLLLEFSKNIKPVGKQQSIKLEITVKKDLPVRPDYGRKLEVYKAKFQFVELKFSGANLHITKVKLPSKALPFKDDALKKTIEANLRVLSEISEKDFLEPFFAVKNSLDLIRGKYFKYIKKREKNIIKRNDKEAFEKELKTVGADIEMVKVEILNNLQNEIQKSRVKIKSNLFDFLVDNPPKEFDGYHGKVLRDEILNATNKIMTAIHFPKAKVLLSGLKLEWHYYDITWQDLNNKEVLEEMQKHNLITDSEKSYFEELAIAVSEPR